MLDVGQINTQGATKKDGRGYTETAFKLIVLKERWEKKSTNSTCNTGQDVINVIQKSTKSSHSLGKGDSTPEDTKEQFMEEEGTT